MRGFLEGVERRYFSDKISDSHAIADKDFAGGLLGGDLVSSQGNDAFMNSI
jgi:hypothetical protein